MNHIKQKNSKDKLSHKQMDLLRRQQYDSALTADWLRDNHLDTAYFNTTDIKLLQALKAANELLNLHKQILAPNQIIKLIQFLQLMAHYKSRSKLKPAHAYPILNINTKVNRQLFKQIKQIQ